MQLQKTNLNHSPVSIAAFPPTQIRISLCPKQRWSPLESPPFPLPTNRNVGFKAQPFSLPPALPGLLTSVSESPPSSSWGLPGLPGGEAEGGGLDECGADAARSGPPRLRRGVLPVPGGPPGLRRGAALRHSG
jgi:hypothetical protein